MRAESESLAELIRRIRQAEALGDYLTAFDQATRGVERFPDDVHLRYLAVRALARAGSALRAEAFYREYGLAGTDDVDIASLEARIAKDKYLQTPRDRSSAAVSARLYEAVFERTRDPFPGINAATMWTFAGDREKSGNLARQVLAICDGRTAASPEEKYWLDATRAEGALLLADLPRARRHLQNAARAAGSLYDATASTAKQLRLICDALGHDHGLLDALPHPGVVFYAGHRIAAPGEEGRFPATLEAAVAGRITRVLERLRAGVGFGSLASGADILFAEALLARGAELHVVLPFDAEEFKQISVAPARGDWVQRFDACLASARSVVHATRGAYLGHDVLFNFAARIAMGLARIRARALASTATMVAVWDRREAGGSAGTAVDIDAWRRTGREAEIVEIEASPQPGRSSARPTGSADGTPPRLILPVLFGDVKDFGSLQEQHLPAFNTRIMGALAETIHRHDDHVLFTNTWGDAVHVVFSDVVAAAHCALEMQEALGRIDGAALGFPGRIGMRISLHCGPVFVGQDPVNRQKTYFGRTLTRAARMEPVTPAGEVYVTERFAALIEMQGGDRLRCDYVGNVPLAKDFGSLRMYRLLRLPE